MAIVAGNAGRSIFILEMVKRDPGIESFIQITTFVPRFQLFTLARLE